MAPVFQTNQERRFVVDFIELSFLVEACIPPHTFRFKGMQWGFFPQNPSYVVSENGDVISLPRVVVHKNGHPQTIHPKVIEPRIDKKGYLYIGTTQANTVKTYKVHQMVAMTFLGHTPGGNSGLVVDHKDNNRQNNHVSNLQLISNRNNTVKDSDRGISSFVGVVWSNEKKRWSARIWHNNKPIHLGYFKVESEAAEYYNNALLCIENDTPEKIVIKKRVVSSAYKGVTYSKHNNKWRAAFRLRDKFYSGGYYDTEIAAYNAYLKLYNEITTGR